MHGKRLRGGDDVTIAQSDSALLALGCGQRSPWLLYFSAVRAAVSGLAGADRDSSLASQTKEAQLHFVPF